jgi:hypothetical protein
MAKLKIRTKQRQTLPGGIYEWQLDFKRAGKHLRRCRTNEHELRAIMDLVHNTGSGKCRITWGKNWLRQRVALSMYLTHKSDVAIIKMCYSEHIRKIYHLKLVEPA